MHFHLNFSNYLATEKNQSSFFLVGCKLIRRGVGEGDRVEWGSLSHDAIFERAEPCHMMIVTSLSTPSAVDISKRLKTLTHVHGGNK